MTLRRTLARLRRTARNRQSAPPIYTRQWSLNPFDCSIAITTSSHARNTISDVLRAWPDSELPQPIVCVDEEMIGAWPSWLAALRKLVDTNPNRSGYIVWQDDAVPSKGLADFVYATLPGEASVVSLCTVDNYAKKAAGWREGGTGFQMSGAQALMFDNLSAKALLTDEAVNSYRWNPVEARKAFWASADGKTHIDGVVGDWCRRTERAIWRHTPSLVGHIGADASTIYETPAITSGRSTKTWPGAEFDCRALIREELPVESVQRLRELENEPRYPSASDAPEVNYVRGLNEMLALLPRLKRVAEIGCYKGVSTECIALHCDHLTAIDPWPDEKIFSAFASRMESYQHVNVIRGTSPGALAKIPDESLDLLYVDGSHRYDDARLDIREGIKKVRRGGFIAGHDHIIYPAHRPFAKNLQVIPAVWDEIGAPDKVFRDSSWLKKV